MKHSYILFLSLVISLVMSTLVFAEDRSVPEQQRRISFPVAWDEHLGDLQPASNGSPIDEKRIARYLRSAHYHLVLDEEPIDFSDFVLAETFTFPDRRFWAWNCRDSTGRKWLVLVGSGRSPFVGESQERIWMFGETDPANNNPREVLIREFPEYAGLAGKEN